MKDKNLNSLAFLTCSWRYLEEMKNEKFRTYQITFLSTKPERSWKYLDYLNHRREIYFNLSWCDKVSFITTRKNSDFATTLHQDQWVAERAFALCWLEFSTDFFNLGSSGTPAHPGCVKLRNVTISHCNSQCSSPLAKSINSALTVLKWDVGKIPCVFASPLSIPPLQHQILVIAIKRPKRNEFLNTSCINMTISYP